MILESTVCGCRSEMTAASGSDVSWPGEEDASDDRECMMDSALQTVFG
jgi:hypothetical protein